MTDYHKAQQLHRLGCNPELACRIVKSFNHALAVDLIEWAEHEASGSDPLEYAAEGMQVWLDAVSEDVELAAIDHGDAYDILNGVFS